MRKAFRRREQGAVLITVCLFLLFLLGFMGFALDFGRLFIVKSELQTAMDGCALSAAKELDGLNDAITRATSAGITAGNLNRVNLQSANWSGQGMLTAADLTFRDSAFVTTTVAALATYAQCQHVQPSVNIWLLKAFAAFAGDTATYPSSQNVVASAVAKRGSAQSTCPIPVALKPKLGGTYPDYGFTMGEWVRLLMGPGEAGNGEIGWANLDGTNSASETEAEMVGSCGTVIGDTLGTPGVQSSVADVWNYRFGIYKNSADPALHRPDESGYVYTTNNWPDGRDAWNGTPSSDPTGTAEKFTTKQTRKANCANLDPNTGVQGLSVCESITGLSLNSFQKLVPPGTGVSSGHEQYGIRNRRVVLVPVIDNASSVIDFVCMFMLQPISIPMAPVQLEYRGNAADLNSPCTTSGIPGGVAGPLVPVLVR